MKPREIEALSFQIIDREAGAHGFSPEQWTIVRRMIHTSADFDYQRSVRFHPRAVTAGLTALRGGCTVFTDTHMARVGIRKGELNRLGASVECLIAEPVIAERARREGTTRALAAVDAVAERMDGAIYVVGNAPTALLRLIQLVEADRAHPALVIGLPVGFVNAAESKAALVRVDVPHITNTGRKGGSNVAAGVLNALSIMAVAEA